MSTKRLKSITFPDLPDTYTIPQVDNTLTQTGEAADAKATGDEISNIKADLDNATGELETQSGYYLEMTNPPEGITVKTNNINGATELKLGVSQGNVLCLPYFRPSGYQQNGLTFTINADGSITVNGTATKDTNYNVAYYQNPLQFYRDSSNAPFGFFLSGCTDGSDSTYFLKDNTTGHVCKTSPVGMWSGSRINTVNLVLVVKSGVTLTDKTFYPMLSLTRDEAYTPPVTPYTATVQDTDADYEWENIQFHDGYNLIAISGGNTITAEWTKYYTLPELKTEIDAIAGDVWTGKKWVAFGTSITDNWSENSYINQGEHTGEHTGKYVPYLLNMSKLSQESFVNRGIAGGSINGHILYYIRYYTADEINADLITIEGAVNDFATSVPLGNVGDTVPYTNNLLPDGTSEGSFAGACYQAFTTALTNAPNAVVVLLTETTGKNHTGYANYNQLRKNSLGLYQEDYIEMTKKVAEFVGIPVIDCGKDSMINAQNPQYIADHIHHTYLGGYQYAKVIWSKLKNIPLKALELPS